MFKLTEDELQEAFEGIEHHGYSTLFPEVLEWDDVKLHWEDIRQALSKIDLDTYSPYTPLRIFAPKNRFNLRVVTHLHPQDLLIYTALVFIIRDDIERARSKKSHKRVFSFRADLRKKGELYQSSGAYSAYQSQSILRASQATTRFVAIADIADFYPRIYQHRLENIIRANATDSRSEDVARVMGKLLSKFADGNSYGIPVGPYASRVLGEAILIDVDDALMLSKLNYVRWVDDFCFFCRSDAEAQHALFFLGKWLYEKHGLTLQSAKTKIVSATFFVDSHVNSLEDRLRAKHEILRDLWSRISPYDDEPDELTDEELTQIHSINFRSMLEDAISNKDSVDYEMAAFLLGRMSKIDNLDDDWRLDLVDSVIENVQHLYPVSDSIAQFFLSFTKLLKKDRVRVSNAVLRPILKPGRTPPPEYYVMWALSIFASDAAWNNADKILEIFQTTDSEVIKRYAAIALSQTGGRSHALIVRDYYERSSPLVRLSILLAARRLGEDERKHWKRMLVLDGLVEKRI